MSSVTIKVRGLEELKKNLSKFGGDLPVYLNGARTEITDEILNTKGLRIYPPETEANRPPVPYYIRGVGTQYSFSNSGGSERLGSQWKSIPYGKIGMKIYNPVSYAGRVHGEEQQANMKRIGWMGLYKVALSKVGVIGEIYSKWVDRLIKKHNL